MKEKFLPIGTVVTLKGATKTIMIIGYLPMTKENVVYDYSACTFPEGVLSADKNLAFNHSQIETINQMGLENEDYKLFNNQVKNAISSVQTMKEIKFPLEDTNTNQMNVSNNAQNVNEPLENQ